MNNPAKNQSRYRREWLIKAPLGLALIGLGVSLTGESAILKGQRQPGVRWFWLGTLGLVVLNSGVSLFGDAVKARALLESRRPK